jgi:hypothetical protein
MKKYIKELEILIEKYVFITNTKEKADIYKARGDAKDILLSLKEEIIKELELLKGKDK